MDHRNSANFVTEATFGDQSARPLPSALNTYHVTLKCLQNRIDVPPLSLYLTVQTYAIKSLDVKPNVACDTAELAL